MLRLLSIGVFSLPALIFHVSIVCGQATSTGSGQAYPNKPIRIITGDPGAGNDVIARIIAQGLTANLGLQVAVDNRNRIAAPELVSKAPADGYILLSYGTTFTLLSLMRDDVPYDPIKDFSPIILTAGTTNVLVVHPSLPVKSVNELIALAKAKPGELNYASSGSGASNHLAGELLKSMAGVNIVRINYKGSVGAISDLVGGRVQLMFVTPPAIIPLVKSGRLRALAVTSAQPTTLAPGLPTVAASGLPGYEASIVYGVLAPAKTPETTVNRLNQEIARVLDTAEVKKRFFDSGLETIGSSPAQFAATIKSEMTRMGKVIKDAGIRDE